MVRQFLIGSAVVVAAVCVRAQSRDGLDVQRARNEHVRSRAKKAYYSRPWNLDGLPHYKPEQHAFGVLRLWGLNYLGDSDLAKGWEEGFRKYQPDVDFEYHLPTALTAIPALITGVADLGASRNITWDELLAFQRTFNYDPLEITMVTGSFDVPGWANALGVFVHKDNPISKLTLKQLDGIFGAERDGGWQGTTWHPEVARSAKENIRTWGQLGLTGEWKDKPIHVYGVNLSYHQNLRFERVVFHGGDKWNEDLHEYANYSKADGTIAIGAQELMEDLSKDRYGIAYSGMQNLTPQTKAVALAVKEGGPSVELTMENVHNRTYPLFGAEFFYINRKPGQPIDPKVKEYVRYVLSREGQQEVARDGKFLPLIPEVVSKELRKLD